MRFIVAHTQTHLLPLRIPGLTTKECAADATFSATATKVFPARQKTPLERLVNGSRGTKGDGAIRRTYSLG